MKEKNLENCSSCLNHWLSFPLRAGPMKFSNQKPLNKLNLIIVWRRRSNFFLYFFVLCWERRCRIYVIMIEMLGSKSQSSYLNVDCRTFNPQQSNCSVPQEEKNIRTCSRQIWHENLSIPPPSLPLIDGQNFAGFWSARNPPRGTNPSKRKHENALFIVISGCPPEGVPLTR